MARYILKKITEALSKIEKCDDIVNSNKLKECLTSAKFHRVFIHIISLLERDTYIKTLPRWIILRLLTLVYYYANSIEQKEIEDLKHIISRNPRFTPFFTKEDKLHIKTYLEKYISLSKIDIEEENFDEYSTEDELPKHLRELSKCINCTKVTYLFCKCDEVGFCSLYCQYIGSTHKCSDKQKKE